MTEHHVYLILEGFARPGLIRCDDRAEAKRVLERYEDPVCRQREGVIHCWI